MYNRTTYLIFKVAGSQPRTQSRPQYVRSFLKVPAHGFHAWNCLLLLTLQPYLIELHYVLSVTLSESSQLVALAQFAPRDTVRKIFQGFLPKDNSWFLKDHVIAKSTCRTLPSTPNLMLQPWFDHGGVVFPQLLFLANR